jgi:hydrogenase maturation protease
LSASKTLVIGIGNEFRQDDAAGLIVAGRLGAEGVPGVEVLSHHGEGTGLMALWQGADKVVIVDAVTSGAKPGTIHRIHANSDAIPPGMTAYSSHAFGLAEAVRLACDLQSLPAQLWIVGIEGERFAHGQDMSPLVADAIPQAIQEVVDILAAQNDILPTSC